MQVFLPHPIFQKSVEVLDKSRLGNQIWRECKTLMNGGWKHHPAYKMWRGHREALALYMWYGNQELRKRGDISYLNYLYLNQFIVPKMNGIPRDEIELPSFIGNDRFHKSHRLNLLWKNPEWYSRYFQEPVPTSKPDYYWPRT